MRDATSIASAGPTESARTACCLRSYDLLYLRSYASVAHGSAYASGMPHMTHERKRALRRRHRHANMHAWQLTEIHSHAQSGRRGFTTRRPDAHTHCADATTPIGEPMHVSMLC